MKNKYPGRISSLISRLKCYILILLMAGGMIIPCSGRAEIVDRIVAQVNADIVTLYELNQLLGPYIEKIKERGLAPDQEQQMLLRAREDALNSLVNDKLTDQEVKKSGIEAGDGEVDDAIKRVRELNSLSQEQLAAALAQDGMTLEDYRKNLKNQLLRTKLLNREVKSKIVITEKDIQTYYQAHRDKFGGEKKYHIRTIIKRVPAFPDEKQKQSVFRQMEAVLDKLNAGEPFDALAQKHSDLLASEGGDLGKFAIDELSPAIRETITGLKVGGYSSIMDTDQGYQIFYLQEILDNTGKSVEEASNEIREILYNEVVDQKFHAWVEGLKKRSHIKIVQ